MLEARIKVSLAVVLLRFMAPARLGPIEPPPSIASPVTVRVPVPVMALAPLPPLMVKLATVRL